MRKLLILGATLASLVAPLAQPAGAASGTSCTASLVSNVYAYDVWVSGASSHHQLWAVATFDDGSSTGGTAITVTARDNKFTADLGAVSGPLPVVVTLSSPSNGQRYASCTVTT